MLPMKIILACRLLLDDILFYCRDNLYRFIEQICISMLILPLAIAHVIRKVSK